MFSKLKQFKELRDKAKQMQGVLASETVTTEIKGIKITMNGNMEITEIVLPENMSREELSSGMKEAFNDAIKKVQKLMAMKMQEMGGIPGLS